MSCADDGGSAFPMPELSGGMSLRDYFAAKAMHVLLSKNMNELDQKIAAQWCYSAADAMIEARK